MKEKTCPKCGQSFPATIAYFYSEKRYTGLSVYCKNCCNASIDRAEAKRRRFAAILRGIKPAWKGGDE